jgi:sugar phosphate permease
MASDVPAVMTAPNRSAAYRWNIIALLAASQVIAYIDRVNLSVAAPVLIMKFHYTPATLGMAWLGISQNWELPRGGNLV